MKQYIKYWIKMSLKHLCILQILHLFHFSCGKVCKHHVSGHYGNQKVSDFTSPFAAPPRLHAGSRESLTSSRSRCRTHLLRSCAGWVLRLLSNRSRGTLMAYVTVTWRRCCFKSDKISNRQWHALLQVSQRSVCAELHEVEQAWGLDILAEGRDRQRADQYRISRQWSK